MEDTVEFSDWEFYNEFSFELQQVAASADGVPDSGYGEWITE